MMRGKIIKGIAGFYYVYTELGLAECKAKGIFRKDNLKPLVGDDVEIQITNEAALEGNIIHILPRHNALIRPASANIDQALVIFAVTRPEPNFNLLDRFLIAMERQNLPVVICFNKAELADENERKRLAGDYEGSGCCTIGSTLGVLHKWTNDNFSVPAEAVANILTHAFISGMLPFMS